MSFSSFISYLRALYPRIPTEHWVIVGSISLVVALYGFIGKKYSVYRAITLGLTVLIGLFLWDALALKRLGDEVIRQTGFNPGMEYQRIVNGSDENRLLLLFNTSVFIPFGLVLSEFLYGESKVDSRCCLKKAIFISLALSLCVEIVQLLFEVGVFELTDIVLNTLGGFLGAVLSLGLRKLLLLRS